MPYSKKSELPVNIRKNLPSKAQEIFKEAYNNAWKEYKDPKKRRTEISREEISQRVAWSAVKKKYIKNKEGKWVRL